MRKRERKKNKSKEESEDTLCGGRVLEKLKQDERSGDEDTCVEEKKQEKKEKEMYGRYGCKKRKEKE